MKSLGITELVKNYEPRNRRIGGVGGKKKVEKPEEFLSSAGFFIWELMGVASGHGNPIKRSRDGKTLPEEEVELDRGQKNQEKVVGKAEVLGKKNPWNSREEQG